VARLAITVALVTLGCTGHNPYMLSVPLEPPLKEPPPIAKCRDGSFSGEHRDPCSSHGGVAEWMPGASP
jgi:hypothetical protein